MTEGRDGPTVREQLTPTLVVMSSVILAVAAFATWIAIKSGPDLSGCTFDEPRNGVHVGLAFALTIFGSIVPYLGLRSRSRRVWVVIAVCLAMMCVVAVADFFALLGVAGSHYCFD